MRTNLTRALADAVQGGGLPIQTARATVVLLRMGGAIGAPDADAFLRQFRGKGRTVKPKTKTPASVGAGSVDSRGTFVLGSATLPLRGPNRAPGR